MHGGLTSSVRRLHHVHERADVVLGPFFLGVHFLWRDAPTHARALDESVSFGWIRDLTRDVRFKQRVSTSSSI